MSKKQKSKCRLVAKISCVLLLFLVIIQSSSKNYPAYSATTTTKIMPLGDSITDWDTWRTLLFNKLTSNGYDVTSVGTRGGHEGHWGFLATDIAASNQLTTWLSSTNPDMVIMHLGTNDCWNNKSTADIINAFTILVGEMRANNPNMTIVVAKIIPMDPDNQADYNARVVALNSAIVTWASELSTSESPIILCDQFTDFDTTTDTYDGVHPNPNGGQKICDNWYETLSTILTPTLEVTPTVAPTVTPTVTPTVAPTATPTVAPTATPTVAPTVTPTVAPTVTPTATPTVTPTSTPVTGYALQLSTEMNVWSNGYTMTVNIKNTSSSDVSGWRLIINKSDFDISSIWCANITEEGDTYMITPVSYNQTISAGGTITFGLQGIGTPVSNFLHTFE